MITLTLRTLNNNAVEILTELSVIQGNFKNITEKSLNRKYISFVNSKSRKVTQMAKCK